MSKYFAISFCSHTAVLALLLSASGEPGRSNVQYFDQISIVTDMEPIMQSTPNTDELASRNVALVSRATNLSSTQDDQRDINLNAKNQKLKIHDYDKILSVIDAPEHNITGPKTKPTLPKSDPTSDEKFIAKPAPAVAKTEVSNRHETQTVPSIEILTPTPKPEVKPDFHTKNLATRNTVHTGNNTKPRYSLKRNLHQQNNTSANVTTKAVLKFNDEFISQLDVAKNTQFSARRMPKQNDRTDPLLSLSPKLSNDQEKRQCNLISRRKTRTEPNIREIQKQIQSRGMTISNILTYRSQQKMNEITISSLLASQLNTLSHNQQRASANIRFLLNTNSFSHYANYLVCEPY